MAYHPRQTHLLSLAGAMGWHTISGDNAMIEQGYAQQRMWRLGDPSAAAGGRADVIPRETEREVRRVIEELGDVHVEGVEVDRAAVGQK
jgi:shikimate 5-dehydrogenase